MRSEVLLPLWENLLDPDKLRPSLIRAGLYLCVHEILVEMLIAFPESLRLDNHPNEFQPQNEYRLSVVPVSHRKRIQVLGKSWGCWKRLGVLNEEDRQSFELAADYRHELAHEAMTRLLLNDEEVWQHYFEKMITLVVKINDWWRTNGEAHVGPNVSAAGNELREHLLFNRIVLRAQIEAALGDEDKARELLSKVQHGKTYKSGNNQLEVSLQEKGERGL